MIWSIIPESVIFAQDTNDEQMRTVEYQGRKLVIRSAADGKSEVVSLLSTDPADYLDMSFAPGSLLDIR